MSYLERIRTENGTHQRIHKLTLAGRSSAQIAELLCLAPSTVRTAISRLRRSGHLEPRERHVATNVPLDVLTAMREAAAARKEPFEVFLRQLLIDSSGMIDAIRDDL